MINELDPMAVILVERLQEVGEYVLRSLFGPDSARIADRCDPMDVTAEIDIDGEWKGLLVVRCSRPLIERLAATMFHRHWSGHASEIDDTLCEVANMIGGNVKSELPESDDGRALSLSLPRVIPPESDERPLPRLPEWPGVAARFSVDGEPFEIEVRREMWGRQYAERSHELR